ncbi:MAG: hypothetical protein JWO32_2346, partial [Bacteroidetes bacterium]|nr:hypothetical protein [Bacteroidota bacterium]
MPLRPCGIQCNKNHRKIVRQLLEILSAFNLKGLKRCS